MSKALKPRKGPSLSRLTVTLRLQLLWMRWSRRRLIKRASRETRRHRWMLARLDSQLLLLKRLDSQVLLLEQHQQDLRESLAFRIKDQLPELEPSTARSEMDQLLGL